MTNPLRGATGALTAETGRIRGHPYVRVGPDPRRTGVNGGPGSGSTGGGEAGASDDSAGPPPLVLVPGLNDPLLSVGDARWFARTMAVYCRRFVRVGAGRASGGGRPVYLVSRPHGLPSDVTTREMAAGYARVLAALSGGRADVMGLSMGGFLATDLAAEHPDRVRRLVCSLSADRLSERGRRTVRGWIGYAVAGNWAGIYREAVDLLARGPLRWGLRAAAAAYARLRDPPEGGPMDFLSSARACLDHDGGDRLAAVAAPTLVVGGDRDPFFSLAAYRRTARSVPDGRLALLRGVGHEAVVEHGRVVERAVRRFLADGEG